MLKICHLVSAHFIMKKKFLHINDQFYKRLQAFLDRNLDKSDLHAESVARALLISKSTLNRKLREMGHPAINEFIKTYRLKKAIIILVAGYKVREVSHQVGFRSPSYFTQCFKAHYHKTPAAFVKTVKLTQN